MDATHDSPPQAPRRGRRVSRSSASMADVARLAGANRCRPATLQAKDFVPGPHQFVAEQHAQFAGREVGEPAHLINRLVAGTAGDDDFHWRSGWQGSFHLQDLGV